MKMAEERKKKYLGSAMSLANLVIEKQEAYGDSFGQADKVIEALYPDGISKAQQKDALTIIRVIDKMFRIANKKDAFGENPWKDIMGYSLLAVVRDQEKKDSGVQVRPGEGSAAARRSAHKPRR